MLRDQMTFNKSQNHLRAFELEETKNVIQTEKVFEMQRPI